MHATFHQGGSIATETRFDVTCPDGTALSPSDGKLFAMSSNFFDKLYADETGAYTYANSEGSTYYLNEVNGAFEVTVRDDVPLGAYYVNLECGHKGDTAYERSNYNSGCTCDWQCYLDNNPELAGVYGATDVAAAEIHYNTYGLNEDRNCCCSSNN